MIAKEGFHAELQDYVHGELPAERHAAIVEYLRTHPEEAALAADLQALAAGVRSTDAPAAPDLLAAVKAGVEERLGTTITASPHRGTRVLRPGLRIFRRRSTIALAVAAALLAYVAIDVTSHHTAFAMALSRLETAQSVCIQGTVLAPGNEYRPLRIWLQKPHKYRVEVGETGRATAIIGEGVGHYRMIVSPEDRIYCYFTELDPGPAAAKLAESLHVPPLPPAKITMAGFSREDIGDLTRYTFTREKAWGTGRNVIELDRAERLLTRHTLSMLDGDQWVLVSDLSYTISPDRLPDSLFAKEPPAGYREVSEEELGPWWFERALAFERAALFASSLRTASMTDAYEIIPDQPSSGDSTWTGSPHLVGGIWMVQAYERPLPDVFRVLGNGFEARTDDAELWQRRVSLTMYYRHGLGPEERLAILGEHMGVRASFSDWVDTTSTVYVFRQDGTPIPPRTSSAHVPFKRETLSGDRVRHWAAGISLRELVQYVWWQSTDWVPGRGMLFAVPADPQRPDPADRLVDADFITDGTWLENADVLKEQFGVSYQMREDRYRTRFIEVSR